VVEWLAEHEPALAEIARAAHACFDPFGPDPFAYARLTRWVPDHCEQPVVEVLQEMCAQHSRAEPGSADERFVAEQNAAVVAGAERYSRAAVQGGAESWNLRDVIPSRRPRRAGSDGRGRAPPRPGRPRPVHGTRDPRYPPPMSNQTELPIPDYDQLPEGSLVHRIRTLDEQGLHALLEHERGHANRPSVLQALTHRRDALAKGEAEPSGGDPAAAQPEVTPTPEVGAGDPVDQTDNNQPLRHGVAGQTPNRNPRTR
jgi:hypothetical protein